MATLEVGLGDTPMRISDRLNGNRFRYGELLAANPHKSLVYVGDKLTFRSLGVGEELNVPSGFVAGVGLDGLVSLPKFVSKGDTLRPGDALNRGEALVTSNGGVLLMQNEGNLVLYGPNGKGQYTALWWTAAHNTPAVRARMSNDDKGNLWLLDPQGKGVWDSVSQGHQSGPATRVIFQTDGNLVWYDRNNKAVYNTQTNGWHMTPSLVHHSSSPFSFVTDAVKDVGHAVTSAVKTVEKIPVLGDVVHIVGEATTAPFKIAANIASGERLDHVAVGAFKDQLKIVKDVAPYAQTVVSFVPGIGTGVAAAIGAGAALAEGQSITQAAKAAIRGALPGGALTATAFDTAMKVASGENVAKATLESARNLVPAGAAQQAFDIGVAVATGEKLQTALAKGLMAIAPGQLQTVIAAGAKAIAATPGFSDALKTVTSSAASEGFQLAAGLLSHQGLNETALKAVRSQLPPEVVQGFDTALKTQVPHIAWLNNVVSSPVTAIAAAAPPKAPQMPAPKAPQMPAPKVAAAAPPKAPQMPAPKAPQMPAPKVAAAAPPKAPQMPAPKAPQMPAPKVAAAAPPKAPQMPAPVAATTPPISRPAPTAYAPYPQQAGVSGTLAGCGAPTCRTLGAPITNMPKAMHWAGLSAVNGSKGRPRMVASPDGKNYLFAIENNVLVARQCEA